MGDKLRALLTNKWFNVAVVSGVAFASMASPEVGACLWFAYFVTWVTAF